MAAPAAGSSPVVDTHIHVWSQDFERYPIRPPEPGLRALRAEGSAEYLLGEMDGHGIRHAVLVQPRQYGWDNPLLSRRSL